MLLKLAPTTEQARVLLDTMHTFNEAANYVASVAWASKTADKFRLQKVVYSELRTTYKLAAQLAIRCISKASEAYKRDKSVKPIFRPEGAVVYDPRIMNFKGIDTVSLLTLSGRVLVPFRFGVYQQSRMDAIKGQADLLYRKGVFYLAVTLEVPTPPSDEVTDTLGVDLGIINLATDSEGETFSGEAVEKNRKRHQSLRQRLQKQGTKSARKHLKKLSGKEARFKKNTNHVISKRIVQKAQANQQAIAIEELRHIRSRTEARLRHSQRARHSSWSFGQLRQFLSSITLIEMPLSISQGLLSCSLLWHLRTNGTIVGSVKGDCKPLPSGMEFMTMLCLAQNSEKGAFCVTKYLKFAESIYRGGAHLPAAIGACTG